MRALYKMSALLCLIYVNLSTTYAAEETKEKPAAPLPPPITFFGQYSFSWAGIFLGKLAIGIEETKDEYQLHLEVVSGGIVNLFTRHENETTASGKRTTTLYKPEHYESYYKTKKKPRHIRLAYDATGKVVDELNEPPENRAIRPEVPADQKKDSYDPLSGMLVIRSGTLTLKAFDVKRLYEVKATEDSKETMAILDKDTPTVHYIFTRKPLAGMTPKETLEYNDGEPLLHFYFSNDERKIPVYMTMPVLMGSVKGLLTKECKTWDECKVK